MRLSTKGRYGSRALLDLALHRSEEPVPLKDIARRQEISLPYLEHLIAPLVAGGIVKSNRGVRGGISVLKHPQDIKLIDVIVLLEGSIGLVDCVNNPKACPRTDLCVTHDIWDEVEKAIEGVLESTTLQDMVERQRQKWDLKQSKEHERQCSSGDDGD